MWCNAAALTCLSIVDRWVVKVDHCVRFAHCPSVSVNSLLQAKDIHLRYK